MTKNINNAELAQAMEWLIKNGMAKKTSLSELTKTQRQAATGTTNYEQARGNRGDFMVHPKR